MFIQKEDIVSASVHISKLMVMAPEGAFEDASQELEIPTTTGCGTSSPSNRKYICALVLPSPMGDAYEIDVNNQVVVGVDEMEKELLMEYDAASRCYYINI